MRAAGIALAILAVAMTGCVSRLQQVKYAQAECSAMGFSGEAEQSCTYNQLQADDAERARRSQAIANAFMAYSAMQNSFYRPTTNCYTSYVGYTAFTHCY